MNIVIIMLIIIVVLSLICTILFNLVLKSFKQNKVLKKRLERRNDNIRYLLDHARSLGEIQKDNSELIRRIRNAQNDDDIDSVLGDIVKCNNDRVPHASS